MSGERNPERGKEKAEEEEEEKKRVKRAKCVYHSSILLLADAVLEDIHEGRHAVRTVEDDGAHGLRVLGGASVEDVVVKVLEDLLDKLLCLSHEGLDALRVVLLEVLLDADHVLLDGGHVELLGEGSLLELVGRDKVDNSANFLTLNTLVGFALLRVHSNATVATNALLDHLALKDIAGALLLAGEGVAGNLVTAEDIKIHLHVVVSVLKQKIKREKKKKKKKD